MSNWQPIETAPKDGIEVFVTLRSGHTTLAWYSADFCGWIPISKWVIQSWTGDDGCPESIPTYMNPTHWMPLPEPPQLDTNK